MRGQWRLMVVAGALALVAPACSSGDDSSASFDSATATDAVERNVDGDDAGTDVAGQVPTGQPVVAAPREVVSTADMRVVAKDVGAASNAAEAAVTERGGFVFGQDDATGGSDRATLTLKVPPAEFRPLLDDLAGLGEVEQRKVVTDDVTAEGADLDARIVSAQKSVERMRSFLDDAANVGELATVESELARRETQLEQLIGQRRVLDAQVTMATVTLIVTETPAPAPPVGDSLRSVPGFGGALADGVNALVKVGRIAAAGVGYALPFAVVIGVPLLVLRAVRRRRGAVPPTAPPSVPPAMAA